MVRNRAVIKRKAAYWAGRLVGPILRAAPGLLRDIAGLSGAASIAYGAWLIYRPAGYIVGGILLVAGAYLNARNEAAE